MSDTTHPLDSGVVDWVWDGRLRAMFNYTDSDLATFARILCRTCAECGADRGQRCVTSTGRELEQLDEQHLARRCLTA